MIKVVVDTNVLVSALLNDSGLPASILDLVVNKRIIMCVSTEILVEYEEVLRRPKFKLSKVHVAQILAIIRSTSQIIKPKRKLQLAKDTDDNIFYECSDASNAEYLITGNIKDYPVGHKRTQVATPRKFIECLGAILLKGR